MTEIIPETGPGRIARIVLVADLVGTALFAAQGALTAIAAGLDLLGITVIAFVSAVGGGILRDVLLGDTPPAALRDQRYAVVILAATVAAMMLAHLPGGVVRDIVLTLDAGGLALFAVAGTQKAMEAGCRTLTVAFLGTITATGGGVVRDVLLNDVPAILRVDFYATAALAGAVVLIFARKAGLAQRPSAMGGGLTCFILRMLAISLHWHLPTLR